jgi:hypothetical protein
VSQYSPRNIGLLILFIVQSLSCAGTSTTQAPPDNTIVSPTATYQLVSFKDQPFISSDDAIYYFTRWLEDSTDYDMHSNKLENFEKCEGYFDFEITTAIKINSRRDGVLGYSRYRLTRDGSLYGLYYSK